jgi:chromosome segregation ATPase
MRKYFESKTRELDDLVGEKKLELDDIKKAMEGSEQNARDLIKSFESSFNMVRKRDEEIKVLSSQLDTFRSAFNDMADASLKADKNLQLLKQESRNVEIVRRSIQNLTSQLGEIKEQSDSILTEFNKKNEEAFEQLRLNLLNTVNLNMGSLQDGLEMAGKRLDTFNSQIEELTGRQALVSENAVKDLTIAMNTRLDSFKESIESFGKSYMERLELLKDKNTAVESEFFAALDKESRSRLDVVRSEIEKEFDSYKDSISGKIESVDNLKQDIESLGTTLQDLRTGMEEVKAKAVDELSRKVQAEEDLFMDNFKSRIDSLEKFASGRMEKLEQAVKALDNLDSLDKKLITTEERLNTIDKIMEWIAKTETRLNDEVRKGEETISILGELVEKPVPISTPDTQMSQSDRNETAKQLIQRGWTNEKIAETLGISEGEVDLIREFYSSH